MTEKVDVRDMRRLLMNFILANAEIAKLTKGRVYAGQPGRKRKPHPTCWCGHPYLQHVPFGPRLRDRKCQTFCGCSIYMPPEPQ